MLVTISSVRGAPGVTTTALLLAAAWPTAAAPDRVVLEADTAGGVLGARYQLGVDPGAVSLISSCRRGDEAPVPEDHGRLLSDGLWVVPGPEVAEKAIAVWRSGATDVAKALSSDQRLWLVDGGRLGPEHPVAPVAASAALNVVMSGSATEDIVQLPARIAALGRLGPTAVIVVGKSGYDEMELCGFIGVDSLWSLPNADDAPELVMKAIRGGRSRRSPLWRAGIDVASDLAAMCRAEPVTEAEGSGEVAPNPAPTEAGANQELDSWAPPLPSSWRPPEPNRSTPTAVPASTHLPSPAIRAAAANADRLKESTTRDQTDRERPVGLVGGHRD